ncbi:MAG: hypothetical protein JWR61_2182 [Ferruginibacter sp.]|uniref:TlpA family protein disulfide reductase n=1 Tax=Ferruginibacter sp. TaxID=1940288 RepID=UPI00265955D4|nr:TlpA disulfide reductase family protein [Ferruginibacter sp.]MDB5277227.1 hypothetical protein [Ferruginibacter sp.]
MRLKLFFCILFLFNCNNLSAQNTKDILQQTYNKCQTIQNGYYEMTRYFKFMDAKDTTKSTSKCYFKRLKDDDFDLAAFRYEDGGISLYTGDDLIIVQPWDSTATIVSKALWAKKIQSQSRSYKFYSPFTNQKYPTVPHDTDLMDKRYICKLIGEENLDNESCFHIQVDDTHKDETSEKMKTILLEYHYWVKKSDFIPIQYSIAYNNVMDNDTMHQYERNTLNKYEINNLNDDNIWTVKSLPAFYTLKDYTPSKNPVTLTRGAIAPEWELLSLKDEKTNLNDFKGQLVLIDFFTKSCYPCILALPGLQALHKKYEKKGLKVIGIDIYDKKEDGIAAFLTKRGVTYKVLLGGKVVSEDYHVAGIPTMYLIDKNGSIIFSRVGYVQGQDKELEKVIQQNL